MSVQAVILAGGPSRRLHGSDKALLMVGGATLLDRAIANVRAVGVERVMAVGPTRSSIAGCEWVQEDPPDGGPAAGCISALRLLEPDDVSLVMACDLPLAGGVLSELVRRGQTAVREGRSGAMVRADGHDQYLLMCVRAGAVLEVVGPASPDGWPMKRLVDALDLERVDVAMIDVLDTDTWEAVAEARQHMSGGIMEHTSQWARRAAEIAEVPDAPLDLDAILALARDAAHAVERPAAPVSTYLLGYAAGARGLDAAHVAELAERLAQAALHGTDD